MATAAQLTVDLTANSAAFVAHMNTARRSLESNTAAMRRGITGVEKGFALATRAAGVFGLGLGVQQLGSFIRAGLDAAGGLGELAEQLGTSTGQLQAYQFGAVQAGASTEQLEAALIQLNRRIGEAAQGDATALEAFERLGVGVLDVEGKIRSADAVLADVADAMQRLPDPAAKIAIGAELMGRNFARLLPLLSGGSAGLRQFAADAEAAGAVLSEDMIAEADRAADALARMEFTLRRAGQAASVYFAGAVEVAADAVRQTFGATIEDEIRRLDSWYSRILNFPSDAIEKALGGLGGGAAAIGFDAGPFFTDNSTDVKIARKKEELRVQRDLVAATAAELALSGRQPAASRNPPREGGAKAAVDQARKEADAIAGTIKALEFEREQLGRTAEAQELFSNLKKAGIDLHHADAGAIVQATEALRQARIEAEAANKIKEEEEALVIRATAAWKAYHEQPQGLEADLHAIDEAAGKARGEMADLDQSAQRANDTARELGLTFTSAFEDAIVGGKGLRDVLAGILKDIARLVIRKGVTEPILDALGKGMGGGSKGGGFIETIIGAVGSALAGSFGGARAKGGPVDAGRAYLVGEEGPEIMVPGRSGSVAPNHAIGGRQTINIDARGADVAAVQRLERVVAHMNATFDSRAQGAVARRVQRGGSYGKAFGR